MTSKPCPSTTPDVPHEARADGWPRVRFLLVYFLAWLLLGLWQGAESVISHRSDMHPPPHWHIYVWEISSALVVGLLALVVARIEDRWRVTGLGVLRRLPLHAVGAVVFSVVHVTLMVWLRKLAYAIGGDHYDFGPVVEGFFYEFQRDLVTYAGILITCALLRTVRERRRQQLRELELRKAASDARLAHLTAQMEPHFLFNTINAISNRMYEDVAAADRMLVALADLLRAAMARDGADRVPVAEDVRWLEAYCHLMTERQPGRLEVELDIGERARRALIPRLLLQPLVENVFRHGLRDGRGKLTIRVQAHDDRLRCSVADNGVGVGEDAEPGLGLGNLRERLALLYPHDHDFTIRPGADGGAEVVVDMPLEHADDAAPGHR
ncbi:histidine kinase [Oleiagrimonas sp. MCCC 1A03011]|uniref:sensor histidine kinase n=1 Tax=Oleiagrimonas sp. MCCC 1A03011 TaxID=1926883 RepID=UPI00143D4462|nr:histidine kinase [Oleiagrimonas sp. MCCC 1A03011]